MKSSKVPVIVLALVLLALIAVPLVIFFAPVGNGGRDAVPGAPYPHAGPVAQSDRDFANLLSQAEALVEERMRAALRAEQLGFDRYQRYRTDLDRARDLYQRGRNEAARERLQRLVEEGEAEIAAIEAREQALSDAESLAARLQENSHLEAHFQNGYREARSLFAQGQSALQRADYVSAKQSFEATAERLDALEEAAEAQAESWLQAARDALADGQVGRAREAYEQALSFVPKHADALAGLAEVESLVTVEAELVAINKLEQAGELDAALAQLETLLQAMPENSLLQARQEALREAILKREHAAALQVAAAAAETGDLDAQIAALERALDLIADPATLEQLRAAVAKRDQLRLETLLSDAFDALRGADYANARDLYREALALKSDSTEAKEGLERSARLLIAEVEFRENLTSAQRLANEGRYPMAASFFNRAMATRPANLPETDTERTLRTTLERQSKQVAVTLRSDNQTHVSIVGVLPPERFRSKELKLYPDVYRIRGTRRGQPDVEMELRVSVDQEPVSLTVIADGK
jgi:tetratricopeptide (TPR) repeat protein